MTIDDWISNADNQLKKVGIETSQIEAYVILESVINQNKAWLLSHNDERLTHAQIKTLNQILKKRLSRQPLAYILGKKEFYGREFIVNNSVLIPRPESEDIIDFVKSLACKDFIDIGTGSGCLAITVALEIANSRVIATDVSTKALDVAKKNAEKLGANEIIFLEADLLKIDNKYLTESTCLIANLPYVPDDLVTSPEINKEPSQALFAGKQGLDVYEQFWNQINMLANNPQTVITESLSTQHFPMENLAKSANYKLLKTAGLVQVFTQ